MVSTRFTPDHQEARCPACGGTIKVIGRRRRVQCPKCREVVTLELAAEPPARLPKPPPPTAAPDDSAREPAHIEAIETRIAALEESVTRKDGATPALHSLEQRITALEDAAKALIAAARPFAKPAFSQRIEAPPDPGITIRHGPPPRLRWLAGDETQLLDITPAQEDALLHNLSAIAGQAITIRTITGNAFVRKRAESLKAVFERAGWTVSGVGEIPRTHAEPGLTLAVGTLPVEKEAAATYLALKAAGFAPVPVLDPALATGGENEAAPLTLTLAPAKAA